MGTCRMSRKVISSPSLIYLFPHRKTIFTKQNGLFVTCFCLSLNHVTPKACVLVCLSILNKLIWLVDLNQIIPLCKVHEACIYFVVFGGTHNLSIYFGTKILPFRLWSYHSLIFFIFH